MNGFFESLKIDNPIEILRVLDKLGKKKKEEIVKELEDGGLSNEKIDKIFQFVEIKDNIIEKLKGLDIADDTYWVGVEELEYVTNRVKDLGIDPANFEIDLTISRGFGYYTGTVFETFLTDYPEFGAIYSGGRYDDLASYYTDSKFPGVGCSIGLTRLFDCLLKENQVDVTQQTSTNVLIIAMEGFDSYALDIGSQLRDADINTEVVFELKGSFKYADKLNIPYVVIIGEEEIKAGKYTLKEMSSGDQTLLSKEELIENLKSILIAK
jgi:histidyl-tRNA synthetase